MYDWLLTGTHRLTATADYYCAATTGPFTVTVFCQPPTGAVIQGPGTLVPGLAGTHTAHTQPITASPPLTFTWDNGVVGATAVYSWSVPGTQAVTVTVTNRCGQAAGLHPVRVLAVWPYSFYLPLLRHDKP